MNIVRWDPFKTMLDWTDRYATLPVDHDRTWAPAVEIYEKGDDLVVRAELPGVEKNDIEVNVEDGVLVLKGERKRSSEVEEAKVYRVERSYGSFVRRFSLPRGLDASRVSAALENGVLEITLPKADEAKSKKVEIKAA